MSDPHLHRDNEERYKQSNDDLKQMRKELNQLSGSVGDLVVAIKGNDLGTEGVLGRLRAMQERIENLEERIDIAEQSARDAKLDAAKKQFYLMAFFSMSGVVVGSLLKTLIDHLFKKP